MGDYLLLDTSGTLGVYYSELNVSSSLAVLCEHEGRKIKYPKIYHGIGPDFFPGPLTMYKNIRRQMPSQVLHLSNHTCLIRKLLPDGVISYENDTDRTNAFIDLFCSSLRNMKNHFGEKKWVVTATGGYDSRACLSLVNKSGLKYSTCTLQHDSISKGDIVVPKKLAEICRCKHYYIKRDKVHFSEKRKENWLVHNCGTSIDADWTFYTYGQYEDLLVQVKSTDIVLIRSSIWENVNCYYNVRYGFKNVSEWDKIFPLVHYNKDFFESMELYESLLHKDTNVQDIGEINRFFLEMRSGCWLSAIEQSFDMIEGITSIQPVNSRKFMSILVGYNEDMRKQKLHEDLISITAMPEFGNVLYDISMHKKRDLIKSLKKKSCKIYFIIKNYGFYNLLNFVFSKL